MGTSWVSCRRLSSYVATRFGRFTPLRWLGTAPVNNCCPNTASAQALRDSNVGRLAAVSRSEWSTILKSGMPRIRRAARRWNRYYTFYAFFTMRHFTIRCRRLGVRHVGFQLDHALLFPQANPSLCLVSDKGYPRHCYNRVGQRTEWI